MSDVERYDPDAREVGCMESHLMGDYVRFEDYIDLLAQRDALVEAIEALLEDLRERARHKVEDGEATEIVLACGNGVLLKADAALARVRGGWG